MADDGGMLPLSIRRARPQDAQAIARVHVDGWRWAYREIMPEGVLEGLSVTDRAAGWTQSLTAFASPSVWVAERDGRVVGFAWTGPSRDADALPTTGELLAIYLEPELVGTGIGRALMARAELELRADGFVGATLWVLAANHLARRFYEASGWSPDGASKHEAFGGIELHEVRYRTAFVTPASGT